MSQSEALQPKPIQTEDFKSFAEFYPFYLGEHSNVVCRVLHYSASFSVLAIVAYAVLTGQYMWLLAAPVAGYGQAWIGHFFFEHNKPATFKYPLWSFMGDWVMLKDFLTGRIQQKMPK